MIFSNPGGGPELACEECGCRWFDRLTNCCYECGTPVPPAEVAEYQRVLREFHGRNGIVINNRADGQE